MRAFVNRVVVIALIGLFATQPQAKAANAATLENATAAPVGYDADFHPVCASGSHYACWFEPYGSRFCGCWLSDRPACPVGYFFACGRVPNGAPNCGCY